MNCKFINVLMFAVGAAIGSAVTYKVVKTKYEQIVQEEINSVKEAFGDMLATRQDQDECEINEDETERPGRTAQIDWDELEDLDEDEDEEPVEINEADFREYANLIEHYNNQDEKGGADNMEYRAMKKPYVISPYDFGELDNYHQIELTYYADGVLEDSEYNIVTDGDELLGPKALYTFGEYEEDAVFVRNEMLMTDFQILKDYRTYAQARSIAPNQVDDE